MSDEIKNPVCTYFFVDVTAHKDHLSAAARAIFGLGALTKDLVINSGDYIVIRADEIGDDTLIIPVTAEMDTSAAKSAIEGQLTNYFKENNWTLTEYQVTTFHPGDVKHKKDKDRSAIAALPDFDPERDRNAWG